MKDDTLYFKTLVFFFWDFKEKKEKGVSDYKKKRR